MKKIQVVWHQNPDTDCTLSAIIMAEYLNNIWYEATPYILGKLNNETIYILETYGIQTPQLQTRLDTESETCLVDHNEVSQSAENMPELNITWLVDHHKMKFESDVPLNIRTEALCSTASILYKMFREADINITKNTAIMMLACIMSDSLMWKSPTTTDEDKVIAAELQKIAEIFDLESFAMAMFDAKSDLGDISISDMIQYDYKVFVFWTKTVGIGTLETTNPWYALGRKEEVLEGFIKLKEEQTLDMIILCVVDILNETNTTIIGDWADADYLSEIFNTSVEDNLADLWKRLSRKKQIVPVFQENI